MHSKRLVAAIDRAMEKQANVDTAIVDELTKMLTEGKGGTKEFKELYNPVKKSLTPEQLVQMTPGGMGAEHLGARNRLRSFKQVATNFKYTPTNIMRAGYNALSEGGGGWRGGSGTIMRHVPMGAKAMTLTSAIPTVMDAAKIEDPTGQGRSRTERAGVAAGELVGGVVGGLPNNVIKRLPGGMLVNVGASLLGMGAGGKVGGMVGKAVDKGVSAARGVASGDVTHQQLANRKALRSRTAGSGAV